MAGVLIGEQRWAANRGLIEGGPEAEQGLCSIGLRFSSCIYWDEAGFNDSIPAPRSAIRTSRHESPINWAYNWKRKEENR